MLRSLIRFAFILSLGQLAIGLFDLRNCTSRACFVRIEKAARDVLRIDWKPISVFPNEGKRFR